MKLFKGLYIFIWSALLTVICCPVFSAEILNRVVAVANNEIITLHELNAKIKVMTGLDPIGLKERDEQGYLKAGRQILDQLINEKLAQEKVSEFGINVSSAEVDNAIAGIMRNTSATREGILAHLKEQGKSYEWYRETIKKQLKRMKLINQQVKSKIIIREERIKDYYNEHKDEYRLEEKVRLAVIFLGQKNLSDSSEARHLRRRADRIVSRLRNGEDFAKLAREFSGGPGADEGGDIGLFKASQLDPELIDIVKAMSVGDISEPIINPSGIRIFKLVEKQEKKLRTMEEVRDAIYRKLYLEEVDIMYSSWVKELREKAYIKIYF
jgi:peptidyl-prolyl cis-trans isomerase SurA